MQEVCLQWFLVAVAVLQVVCQQEQQDAAVLQALLPSVSVWSAAGFSDFCLYMRTEIDKNCCKDVEMKRVKRNIKCSYLKVTNFLRLQQHTVALSSTILIEERLYK